MKKLSDYQGDEAIELWADLLDPMTRILSDPEIAEVTRSGKPPFLIAKAILKAHASDAKEIMMRIDPTPVDGVNFATRFVSLVLEIMNSDELKGFFASAGQARTESDVSGSVMENTEAAEA